MKSTTASRLGNEGDAICAPYFWENQVFKFSLHPKLSLQCYHRIHLTSTILQCIKFDDKSDRRRIEKLEVGFWAFSISFTGYYRNLRTKRNVIDNFDKNDKGPDNLGFNSLNPILDPRL